MLKVSASILISRHLARWHPLRSHQASWESHISCVRAVLHVIFV